ncbi:MAG: LUD domain-containing protein, partial [Gammaproteobacteria bacterium]
MEPVSHEFKQRAEAALVDPQLRLAMQRAKTGFMDKRREAADALPEFEDLRTLAHEIKEHTLSSLDYYLEHFEAQVRATGGHVHWASTPAQAREIIVGICREAGAQRVTKGKSMVGEEMGINEALDEAGFDT